MLSWQTIDTEPAPHGQVRVRVHRFLERGITDWETTPGKLRVVRVLLVLAVLLCGLVGVYAAAVRADAARDIQGRIAPLNDTVMTLYRSLAEAHATVTSSFLSGEVELREVRAQYDKNIAQAATSLTKAGAQDSDDLVTTDRITDLNAQLPVYTGLVDRAWANNRQGFPVGVAYLQRATNLMQSSILPEAEALRREQATRLDESYQRARSLPILVLTFALSAVSLAGLIWVQLILFRRTHRVFNIGLVAATVAVLAGLLWWTVAGTISANHLKGSLGHSGSVSDALGPAQIAALQARAAESLGLVTYNSTATEQDFDANMQLLARNRGAGGALGAAQRFATDQQGRDLVAKAVARSIGYTTAHQVVRRLNSEGQHTEAVDAAVGEAQDSAATAFGDLDTALAAAVTHERIAFAEDIGRARAWLRGLEVGTGALAVGAAVGIALGIRQRLEEYR